MSKIGRTLAPDLPDVIRLTSFVMLDMVANCNCPKTLPETMLWLVPFCVVCLSKQLVGASVDSVGSLQTKEMIDCSFKPFLMKGLISLIGKPEDQKEIQIL